MRIALACGGTGGHIFPGLATAEECRRRRHEVTLWLAGKDTESVVAERWDGPVVTVPAQGFSDLKSLGALRTLWTLMRAARSCRKRMRDERPHVLLAMGSYASVGPVWAAVRLGIPTVLHEANVLPGRAVRLFSRYADTVAASFEETRFYLRGRELVVTGMPLRQDLAEGARRSPPPPGPEGLLRVLIMGGSRGAHRLNEMVTRGLAACSALGYRFDVVHLAGAHDEALVRAAYREAGVEATVHAFTHDMAEIYCTRDLAICRAGAATCAELSAFGVPALLIPYPYAVADHQTANARAMEKIGAADVVPEEGLSEDWIKDYVVQCVQHPERLVRMREASSGRGNGKSAEALADLLLRVAEKRHPAPEG